MNRGKKRKKKGDALAFLTLGEIKKGGRGKKGDALAFLTLGEICL